jgi:hypothetical protein
VAVVRAALVLFIVSNARLVLLKFLNGFKKGMAAAVNPMPEDSSFSSTAFLTSDPS